MEASYGQKNISDNVGSSTDCHVSTFCSFASPTIGFDETSGDLNANAYGAANAEELQDMAERGELDDGTSGLFSSMLPKAYSLLSASGATITNVATDSMGRYTVDSTHCDSSLITGIKFKQGEHTLSRIEVSVDTDVLVEQDNGSIGILYEKLEDGRTIDTVLSTPSCASCDGSYLNWTIGLDDIMSKLKAGTSENRSFEVVYEDGGGTNFDVRIIPVVSAQDDLLETVGTPQYAIPQSVVATDPIPESIQKIRVRVEKNNEYDYLGMEVWAATENGEIWNEKLSSGAIKITFSMPTTCPYLDFDNGRILRLRRWDDTQKKEYFYDVTVNEGNGSFVTDTMGYYEFETVETGLLRVVDTPLYAIPQSVEVTDPIPENIEIFCIREADDQEHNMLGFDIWASLEGGGEIQNEKLSSGEIKITFSMPTTCPYLDFDNGRILRLRRWDDTQKKEYFYDVTVNEGNGSFITDTMGYYEFETVETGLLRTIGNPQYAIPRAVDEVEAIPQDIEKIAVSEETYKDGDDNDCLALSIWACTDSDEIHEGKLTSGKIKLTFDMPYSCPFLGLDDTTTLCVKRWSESESKMYTYDVSVNATDHTGSFITDTMGFYELYVNLDSYPGFYITNRDVFVRIDGWEESFQSLYNGDEPAIVSNIPGEMSVVWDSQINAYWLKPNPATFNDIYDFEVNLTEESMRMIYKNIDISTGVNFTMGCEFPSAECTSFSSVGYGDLFIGGNRQQLDSLRQSSMTETHNLDDPMYAVMSYMIAAREKRGTVTTLTPQGYDDGMNVNVWYDASDNPYNFTPDLGAGNESYIEITRMRVTNRNTSTIVIDENEGFIFGERCFDTSAAKSAYAGKFEVDENESVQFDTNRLTYYLSEAKLGSASQYASKPLITTVSFDDAQSNFSIQETESDGDIQYSKSGNNVIITAKIVDGSGNSYRNAFGQYKVTYTDKNGDDQVRIFSIDHVVIRNQTAYEVAGWHPVDSSRFAPDPAYVSKGGTSRGYNLEYIGKGEVGLKWTGDPVDLSGLPGFATVLITPPSSADLGGGTLTGWSTAGSEGERFYAPDDSFVSSVKGRLDADITRALPAGGAPVEIRFSGYYPVKINAGGMDFYTLHRMDDDIDSSSWHFIDWQYELNGVDYHWYDYFFMTTHDEHTETMMSDAAAARCGYPTIRSLSGTFSVTAQYYPAGNNGDINAALMEINATDNEGHAPSDGNTVTILMTYPEGVTYANYDQCGFELLHYVDGLEEAAVSEELTFGPDGITVVLSSCSPFLLIWNDPDDSGNNNNNNNNNGNRYSGGSGGSGGGGGSAVSSSGVAPKPAVTPITTDAKGNQLMGTSIVSKPVAALTAAEKPYLLPAGYSWQKTATGYYELKDTAGVPVTSRWVLVPDSLWSKPAGNASWFYFDAVGHMLTGWQYIMGADGKYRLYYFNEEGNELYGALLCGGTVGGITLNAEGQAMENGVVKEWTYKPY